MFTTNVIVNALRYGTSRIAIQACITDDYLSIKIEDDGNGYPEEMLTKSHSTLSNFELSQGRTGLGLFFAKLIADAHSHNDKAGIISLSNGGSLGGSVFEVKIP